MCGNSDKSMRLIVAKLKRIGKNSRTIRDLSLYSHIQCTECTTRILSHRIATRQQFLLRIKKTGKNILKTMNEDKILSKYRLQ